MSTYQAAARLGWNQSKVSRIETARTKPEAGDVAGLLGVYGVDTATRAVLMELQKQATRLGWWTEFGVFNGAYVALEDEATQIQIWEPQIIPGLLQTADYARAIIAVGFPEDPDEVERRVRARAARQALLSRDDAPRLFVIVDESALRRPIGGRDVMQEQLTSLLEAMKRDKVRVRVLPGTQGAHAGLAGSFVLLSFEPDDPDVAYIENVGGDVYVEGAAQLDLIRLRWDRIVNVSLSEDESAKLIADLY